LASSASSASICSGQRRSRRRALPPQPAEQLDRLVAPIALYPDPVLAQVLMVATYPESAHPRFLQILSELGPLEDR